MTSGPRKDTTNAWVFAEWMESSCVTYPHSGSSQREVMLCKTDRFQNPYEIQFTTKTVETTHGQKMRVTKCHIRRQAWIIPGCGPGTLKSKVGRSQARPSVHTGTRWPVKACWRVGSQVKQCPEVSVIFNKSLNLPVALISLVSGQRQIRLKIRLKDPSRH